MNHTSWAALWALLTMGLPWLGALFVWLAGDKRSRWQHGGAAVFSVLAGVAGLLLIPLATNEVVWSLTVGEAFGTFTIVPDGLGVFLTVVATVIGSLAVIFSAAYMRGEAQLGRYYALVLLFIGSMSGLALSGNLLQLFIFWEMTALCSYALISFHNDDPQAVAGGVKALVITQLGGVGLLAGVLALRAPLGDYQISTLLAQAEALPAATLALAAYGFLLAAAAKSAQVPLHTWLPDAMEAPTPVSALIHAATMVNAGVYLLARFYPAFEGVAGWQTAVITIGLLSALLAGLMAVVATDLKRALAYSTVSQLGYMVYAVGVGAIFASQLHLMSHAVFKALLFLAAGAVIHATGTRDMRQMGGLWGSLRFVGVVFVLGAAALAGLPLLNGFWSKELVLEAGLAHGPLWAYGVMLAVAGVTALYALRMVWLVFFGAPRHVTRGLALHTPPAMRLALAPLALGTLLTWLLAGPFSGWLARTLPFHHLHAETTGALVGEVLLNPATLLALALVAVGLALWQLRARLAAWTARLAWLAGWAAAGFGFEWVNGRFVKSTQTLGARLQLSQTGQLGWNLVGILLGVLLVTAVLLAGGAP